MKSAHYFFRKRKKNETKRDKTIHGGHDKKRKELKYEQRASEKKKEKQKTPRNKRNVEAKKQK